MLCEETANDKERAFFDKAARKLRDKQIKSGIMNCKDLLPTGENARKRFKLKKSTGDPIIILAANGRKPRQVGLSTDSSSSLPAFLWFFVLLAPNSSVVTVFGCVSAG